MKRILLAKYRKPRLDQALQTLHGKCQDWLIMKWSDEKKFNMLGGNEYKWIRPLTPVHTILLSTSVGS